MAGEWSTARFEQLLAEPVRNGIYKKKEFHGCGAKIVNMGELFAYPRLRSVAMKRVELSDGELRRFDVRKGDLLFARRSLVAEGAGKCSVVLDVDELTTFESSIIRARPDPTKADSLFLYYFFNSHLGLHALDTIRRQVAVAGITGSDLVRLDISVPPLPEQHTIAHILGTLDDKIELNRRMNETLEAMARAIFKSWFIDFDPVRRNAARARNQPSPGASGYPPPTGEARGEGRVEKLDALFPDSFEDSELGEIPAGWEVCSFASTVDVLGGGTPKTSVGEYWGGAIPWFSVVDAPRDTDVFVLDTEKKITQAGLEHSAALLLTEGTSIISARGTVGRVALVGVPMAMNQSCYGLSGKVGKLGFFTYYSTRSLVSTLKQRSHGSVFDTITRDTLAGIAVANPPSIIIEAFERRVTPALERIRNSLLQSHILDALREALLPKLIAGDLRVTEMTRSCSHV